MPGPMEYAKAPHPLLPRFITLALILGAVALIVTLIPHPPPGPPLYRFYPDSANFYLQFKPGEQLSERFLVFLDSKARRIKTRDPFGEGLLEKFGTTFEPQFSFGIWPDQKDITSSQILLAFPLKQPMTLNDLIARFHWQLDDFTRTRVLNTDVLTDKTSGSTLAVADNDFLVASTEDALTTALTTRFQQTPNVYDNTLNKKYLSKLPWRRDGTLIINNAAYLQQALQSGDQLPKPVIEKMRKFAGVLPVTLAAVSVEDNRYLHIKTVTPLMLQGFDSSNFGPDFRKDLRQTYTQTIGFKTPGAMPADTTLIIAWAGFDKFYDLYTQYLANPDEKMLAHLYGSILGSKNLDLRKDVVGLSEGEAAVALRQNSPYPILLLSRTPEKENTLHRLTDLLASSPIPVEQSTEQFGDISAQTLSVPRKNIRVSYGGVGSVIGAGLSTQFADLVKVNEGQMQRLPSNSTYNRLMQGMPWYANGMFYANLHDAALSNAPKPEIFQRLARWVDAASGMIWAKKDSDDADLVYGQFTLMLSKP